MPRRRPRGWWPSDWLAVAAICGVISIVWRFGRDAPHLALQAAALVLAGIAAAVALVFVGVPALLEWLRAAPDSGEAETTAQDLGGRSTAAAVGGTSAGALLLSVLVQLRARMNDSRLLARAVKSGREGVTGYVTNTLLPRLRATLVLVVTAVAGPLLLGGIVFAVRAARRRRRHAERAVRLALLARRGAVRGAVAVRRRDVVVAAPVLPAPAGDRLRAAADRRRRSRGRRGTRLRQLRAALEVRRRAGRGRAEATRMAAARGLRGGQRLRRRADAARPAGDELHVQPADDRRAADRLRVDAGVRRAARGPPPRLHADGRGGDVRRRPRPLDGQADALAAALPAHARQRPARRLGPQPAPPRPAATGRGGRVRTCS